MGIAFDIVQPDVLGADARIVQAGGDRVRLGDLTVAVLHDRRQRAVQHTRAPAHGQRRKYQRPPEAEAEIFQRQTYTAQRLMS